MASGFCPRAASTVSVFSRNLWQQAPHMQTPRISAMKCVSATWIQLEHMGSLKGVKGHLGLAYSKASPFCETAACTTSSLAPEFRHFCSCDQRISAVIMRTLASEKTWSKNYGPPSASQELWPCINFPTSLITQLLFAT